MTEEQIQKAMQLAERVVRVSQNTLLLNLRFMDTAIFRLKAVQVPFPLGTDGEHLYYNYAYILPRYKENQAQVVRDILHVILHCLFRHFSVPVSIRQTVWDLATDIAVENIINSLSLSCVASGRQREQEKTVGQLSQNLKSLNAEKIYRYYMDRGVTDEEADGLRQLFQSDDHALWYSWEQPDNDNLVSSVDERSNANGNQKQNEKKNKESNEDADDSGNGEPYDWKFKLRYDSNRQKLAQEWEDAARHVQLDLQDFSNGRGGITEGIIQQLQEVNRERYDYTAFLKKFAVMGETMKINDDEFDYVFYTYGLKLFGNVPLIEPLEYKEVKRIKEFIIAIDTSGSVQGDLVQKFVQKTYNVLKSTESFFSKINLHIIQCDDQIQEDVKITTQEDFDYYFADMQLKGFGGNNEIRLFAYVDDLVKKKEFSNLKGMIYFTDGYGIFPKKKPDYEVAFVFLENARWSIPTDIPAWVIKLVLDSDEI